MAVEAQKRKLQRLSAAYKQVLGTPQGKQVFADQAQFGHFYATTHVEGDPCGTSQLEGRRQMVLRWLEFSKVTQEDIDQIVDAGYVEE